MTRSGARFIELRYGANKALEWTGYALCYYALLIVFLQTLHYLMAGTWPSCPLLLLFMPSEAIPAHFPGWLGSSVTEVLAAIIPELPIDGVWIFAPESWLGLHGIVYAVLSTVSVAFAAFLIGAVIGVVAHLQEDELLILMEQTTVDAYKTRKKKELRY